MKNNQLLIGILGVLFTIFSVNAQPSIATTTVSNCKTQIVTLTATVMSGGLCTNAVYYLSTNQIVTLNNVGSSIGNVSIGFYYANGYYNSYSGTGISNLPVTYTGLSSITVSCGGYTPLVNSATFTILTPSTNSVTYTPANSVVIPSDATGNVQIILQSSSDLV